VLWASLPRARYRDRPHESLLEAVEPGRRSVTQRGVGPRRDDAGQGEPVGSQRQVTDRVHAGVDHDQLARADSQIDRSPADPELEKLPPGHHAVLPTGQARDHRIGPADPTKVNLATKEVCESAYVRH
jgi:hypothetical protein